MTKTIYKYQMPVSETFELELPQGAEIIRVDDVDGKLWLWAIVDPDAPPEPRVFMMFKTGSVIPENVDLLYLGFCKVFVQMELGLYVFEVTS